MFGWVIGCGETQKSLQVLQQTSTDTRGLWPSTKVPYVCLTRVRLAQEVFLEGLLLPREAYPKSHKFLSAASFESVTQHIAS